MPAVVVKSFAERDTRKPVMRRVLYRFQPQAGRAVPDDIARHRAKCEHEDEGISDIAGSSLRNRADLLCAFQYCCGKPTGRDKKSDARGVEATFRHRLAAVEHHQDG